MVVPMLWRFAGRGLFRLRRDSSVPFLPSSARWRRFRGELRTATVIPAKAGIQCSRKRERVVHFVWYKHG